MFKADIDASRLDQLQTACRRAGIDFQAQQRDVLEALGGRVLSFAMQDYRTKARGGTGSDGIKWAPLKESTERAKARKGKRKASKSSSKRKGQKPAAKGPVPKSNIGIDTGLQQASGQPGFAGNLFILGQTEVTVGYNRSYSKFFDEKRPLLPTALPEAWRPELDAIVTRWADNIIQQIR